MAPVLVPIGVRASADSSESPLGGSKRTVIQQIGRCAPASRVFGGGDDPEAPRTIVERHLRDVPRGRSSKNSRAEDAAHADISSPAWLLRTLTARLRSSRRPCPTARLVRRGAWENAHVGGVDFRVHSTANECWVVDDTDSTQTGPVT
jgi:hypothetical protein